jgi:DNA end-binding protein Ku
MAARAMASGTISFGLVSVPIKLFSGTQAQNLSFNMLHDKDKSRLRQQYICSACGEVVDRDHTVRGYEYAKDQYAVLTPEEIKALDQTTDQSIEIEEFIPISSIDPIYFEKTYLLGPDKGGAKAYRLLREAMAEAGKGAVAKFATRGRQQLVLLREAHGGLMMHALFYADEVRDFSEIDHGESVTPKPGEIQLAIQLIEQLASPAFDATKYEDEYRKRALEVIEQKVAGQEVTLAPAHAPKGQIIDLMEALKASLASRQPKAAAPKGAEAGRKPARAKGTAPAATGKVRKAK